MKPKNILKKRFLSKISALFLFCFLLFNFYSSYAQISYENLQFSFPYRNSDQKKIQFSCNIFSFVHNREYFENIADGYTRMGYWVNPKIAYQPSAKVLVEGGVYLRKEIGKTGLAEIEPTLTIKIRNENWSYLFGNLEGNLSHRLVEPLMDFERILTQPLEHGLQAKYLKNDTFFDVWLDYQQSTIAGQTQQEHFFGGISYIKPLLKFNDLQVLGIAQTTIYHQGGQNLVNNLLPVRTIMNPTLGLELRQHLLNKSTLKFANYYVIYSEQSKKGGAFYSNLSWSKNNWQIMTSYWNSTNFVSEFGGDLYQSASREFGLSNYYETHRELVFFRFVKDWKVMDGMYVSLKFEPYLDLRNHLFEHEEGIYLRYGL